MKELDGFTDDEKIISQAVTKICSSFGYIQMFPAESKTWLIEEASKGVSGMLAYSISMKNDLNKKYTQDSRLNLANVVVRLLLFTKSWFIH